MKVKGKYSHENKHSDCEFIIENGKIQMFNCQNDETIYLNISDRKHSTDYELEKLYDVKNSPINYNYVLKYFGGSQKPFLIYLKLNYYEIIRLKFAMRKMLIQSNEIKVEILKYFITALLSFILGVLYQQYQNENQKLKNNGKTIIDN